MSYILDALRKADAERERDPARGIHAQPALLRAGMQEGLRGPVVAWAAVAVVLGAGIAAAAFLWSSRGEPHAPAAPLAAALSASNSGAQQDSVAPETPAQGAQDPAASHASTTSLRAPAPVILPIPEPVAPVKAARVSVAAKGAPSSAAVPAASERVVEAAQLPDDVKRELPKLAISGGVYSKDPSQRMLIVGGQVVNEGAELAPGLRLQEIRAKTAVLGFRGWRYSVTY